MTTPAEVLQTAALFRRALRAGEQSAVAAMLQTWRGVESRLLADMEALVASLEGGRPLTRRELLQLQRFQSLLAQTTQQLRALERVAAGIIEAGQIQAATQGIAAATTMIETVGLGVAFNRLPVTAVANLVSLARNGRPLAALLRPMYGLATEGILRELVNGLALGNGPRQVARRMVDAGLSDGLNHLLLVTRDQYNRAHRAAGLETYRNSGVVLGWVRLSARDARVCPACMALDGSEHATDEGIDTHPQCRCTTVPQVRGARPLQLGTGLEWFERQSPGVQRGILGPGVYDHWRETGFDLREIVAFRESETWGRSPVVRPLRELV